MTFDPVSLKLYASANASYNYSLPVRYKLKLQGQLFNDKEVDQLSKEVLIKVVGDVSGRDKR